MCQFFYDSVSYCLVNISHLMLMSGFPRCDVSRLLSCAIRRGQLDQARYNIYGHKVPQTLPAASTLLRSSETLFSRPGRFVKLVSERSLIDNAGTLSSRAFPYYYSACGRKTNLGICTLGETGNAIPRASSINSYPSAGN